MQEMRVSIVLISGVMCGIEFDRDDYGSILVIDLLIVRFAFEWE